MRQDTKDTIDRYVENRIPAGGFVTAVLANDLMGAFSQADEDNRSNLFEICQYVYMDIPSGCHGSYGIVEVWLHPETVEEED